MAKATEVQLTSGRSARWQKGLVAASLIGTLVGAAVAVASDPPWWVIRIWAGTALVLTLILVALWASAGEAADLTAVLEKSGVATRADVIHGAIVDDGEQLRSELTLEIRPVGSEAFTVTHRCGDSGCKAAATSVPTTITVLVDASTRTWAAMHG